MSKRTRFSAKTSVVTRCRTGPAISEKRLAKISRRWRRWRPTPSWPRRKSAASRPKNNSSATPEGRKKLGKPAAPLPDQPDPKAQQLHRSGQPHYVEGRLRPSLQRTGSRRRRGLINTSRTNRRGKGSDQANWCPWSRPSRTFPPQARAAIWLPQRSQSQSGGFEHAVSTAMSHLTRRSTRQRQTEVGGPPTQLMRKKIDDKASNALPIEKSKWWSRCFRQIKQGTRLPPVSVARRQESTCRVGHDLHHPQSPGNFFTHARLPEAAAQMPGRDAYLDGLLVPRRAVPFHDNPP